MSLLVEMAKDSDGRFGQVFADKVGGEAGPGRKMAVVNVALIQVEGTG